jgi:hypothetical protein
MSDPYPVSESDLVVIGGGIAALVAAFTAGNAGARVSLLLPPHGIGAGFASLTTGKYQLDVGCRRFDFTTDADIDAASLALYEPGRRVRPFAHHVRSFIENDLELELRSTSAPLISYDRKLAPDFATSLDLTSLPDLLSSSDLKQVIDETDAILSSVPPSPTTLGMGSWPDLSKNNLRDASIANHGHTFHSRLITPFAQKLDQTGWADIPADLASKIWTPLFFPRTINQGCRRQLDRDRSPVTYFYPAAGHFGDVVDRLLRKIRETSTIQIVPNLSPSSISAEGQQTIIETIAGATFRWSCPFVLGSSVEQYCSLAGLRETVDKLPLAIIWVEIAKDDLLVDPSTIMVHDDETPVYRISIAGEGAEDGHVILALEMTGMSPECCNVGATTTLQRLGIIRTGSSVASIRQEPNLKIMAPSLKNRATLRLAHAAFDQMGVNPIRVASLNDLKADMLNDQTLQGLKIGKSLSL